MTLNVRSTVLVYGIRALLWGAVLFTFISAVVPPTEAPHLFPWDKAEHFAAFYLLASLAAMAYPRTPLLLLGLWLSLFGGVIELVQALPLIHRDCDIRDWFADAVAVTAALMPMFLDRWRRSGRRSHSGNTESSCQLTDGSDNPELA